jgi:hypothetical protein
MYHINTFVVNFTIQFNRTEKNPVLYMIKTVQVK